MVKPPKLIPPSSTTATIEVTNSRFNAGLLKPIQLKIDPLLHREIKTYATEIDKSMTELLLDGYRLYRKVNN